MAPPPPDHPPHLPAQVRSFGACTADLHRLADWLVECGVTTIAMESTGVYWIPLFELLESRGLEVYLADPRQSRHAPGRPKSDVRDCQWLQRLHSYGLLAASFRPAEQVLVLRSYLRQRQMLIGYAGQQRGQDRRKHGLAIPTIVRHGTPFPPARREQVRTYSVHSVRIA
jgi:transposase